LIYLEKTNQTGQIQTVKTYSKP